MTLLEPWVMMRLMAGLVATLLFAYGAFVGARILKYAHLGAATEGQLSLERQFELAATLVRFAAMVQLLSLLLSVLAADRLSGSIRGAMCGYGVVAQNRWGWVSIGVTLVVSLVSAILLQLLLLDRNVRGLDLLRPLAFFCIALAPAAAFDLGLALGWLTRLDLTVVASCCSTTLDAARREGNEYWQGPRLLATWSAVVGVALAIVAALLARRRPGRALVGVAGAVSLALVPVAIVAVVLEVAPHVYEVPQHLCPFCLFKEDAYFIGYPLFAAIFLAATWGLGAGAAAFVSTGEHARNAFPAFARSRMVRQAVAWTVALALGAGPVALHAVHSPGASLFR
ncbi:MAG TPA: hypothetical protein VF881_10665 [Polyangiaceae bacterium]